MQRLFAHGWLIVLNSWKLWDFKTLWLIVRQLGPGSVKEHHGLLQRLHMRRSLTAVLVKVNVLLFTTRYISYLKHELSSQKQFIFIMQFIFLLAKIPKLHIEQFSLQFWKTKIKTIKTTDQNKKG